MLPLEILPFDCLMTVPESRFWQNLTPKVSAGKQIVKMNFQTTRPAVLFGYLYKLKSGFYDRIQFHRRLCYK